MGSHKTSKIFDKVPNESHMSSIVLLDLINAESSLGAHVTYFMLWLRHIGVR